MPHCLDALAVDRSSSTSIPKQIATTVARLVEQGELRPGDRLPTLAQLAERVDASLGTVRHAYDLLAERGLVEKTAGRGTFVAPRPPEPPGEPGLSTMGTESPGRGVRAGILCGRMMLEKIGKFRTIVEEFERLVSRAGGSCRIVTCNRTGPPGPRWDDLAACDVLLYLHPLRAGDRLLERLMSFGRPLVAINYTGTLKVNRLVEDWDWAMRQVVMHLVGEGHRSLMMLSLSPDPEDPGFSWVGERERAFVSECANQGLAAAAVGIWRTPVRDCNAYAAQALRPFVARLEGHTAVVTVNSALAAAFIKAAAAADLSVPEDVSLVAFDNTFETQLHNVTTVVHPDRSEAVGASESLSMQLRVGAGSIVTQISNRPELLHRGSVRRPG